MKCYLVLLRARSFERPENKSTGTLNLSRHFPEVLYVRMSLSFSPEVKWTSFVVQSLSNVQLSPCVSTAGGEFTVSEAGFFSSLFSTTPESMFLVLHCASLFQEMGSYIHNVLFLIELFSKPI